jgi:hypothetical protein
MKKRNVSVAETVTLIVKPVTDIATNIVIDVTKDTLLNQELTPPVGVIAHLHTTKKKRPENVRNVKNHVKMNVKLVPVVLLVTLVMMDTSTITDNVSKSAQMEDGQTPKLTDVTYVTKLAKPVKDLRLLTVLLVAAQDT